MDERFFPHTTNGSLNVQPSYTFPATFNFKPDTPIALDARSVISEWSDDALATLRKDEVYVGQQIYCLSDKNYRICRWIPGVGKYSGKNCIWDSLHTGDDTKNQWVDIKTYTPAKTVDELIEEENKKLWRYSIEQEYSYWTFYKFDKHVETAEEIKELLEQEDFMNKVLLNAINGASNNDILSSKVSNIIISYTPSVLSLEIPSVKTKKAKTDAADSYYIIFISEKTGKKVTNITFNDKISQDDNLLLWTGDLDCINASFEFDKVKYKCYVLSAAKITEFTGLSTKPIKLTLTAES